MLNRLWHREVAKMKKQEFDQRYEYYLNEINKMLNEQGNETEIDNIGDADGTKSIVCEFDAGINNDKVLANYYFLPVLDEETSVGYFVQAITLVDDIDGDDKKLQMLQAVNTVNALMPYGAFVFSTDLTTLTYRYILPIHEALTKEAALDLIYGELFTGIGLVNTYVAPLLELLYDNIDWDTFQEILIAYNEAVEE